MIPSECALADTSFAVPEEIYVLGLQKFLEEAKVLWGLSKPERHPNIVNVRSLFEIHGTAYMVMDFESGVSLSQMLRDGHKFDEVSLLTLITPNKNTKKITVNWVESPLPWAGRRVPLSGSGCGRGRPTTRRRTPPR